MCHYRAYNPTGSCQGSGSWNLWVREAPATNKPQTEAAAEYGKEHGRALPTPEILQPSLDASLPAYKKVSAELSGHFVAAASDVLPDIANAWIKAFQKLYPKVEIELKPPYAGSLGAKELIKGNLRLRVCFS